VDVTSKLSKDELKTVTKKNIVSSKFSIEDVYNDQTYKFTFTPKLIVPDSIDGRKDAVKVYGFDESNSINIYAYKKSYPDVINEKRAEVESLNQKEYILNTFKTSYIDNLPGYTSFWNTIIEVDDNYTIEIVSASTSSKQIYDQIVNSVSEVK
jgi:hypothetical protein